MHILAKKQLDLELIQKKILLRANIRNVKDLYKKIVNKVSIWN